MNIMSKQTFQRDQLKEGHPLYYHQNALAYIFGNSSGYNFPTQLVYPDDSISVGLNANRKLTTLPRVYNDDTDEDEENSENKANLLIYASESPDEVIKTRLYSYFFKLVLCSLLQLLSLCILTIVLKASIHKSYFFWLLLVLDIPLCFATFHKKFLPCQFLQVLHIFLIFTVFFLKLHSIFDLLMTLGFFYKSYCFKKMLYLIMPHVFTVNADLSSFTI